ncbi:DUF6519 domain-containing protein [Paraburkholderia sp. J7]|uniref:DUF6519 domain-containing protein n=1 Tax=Paraburkholderia sp. J7 TaxID=2805438 RepID=UPI002AB6B1A2|nr:DUF6519 domain-containing protein [Paraburkholderia sp. J7]
MKADLTRVSFDPLKHFSRVVMQQGRVQLDADWNEQAEILLHVLRTMAADGFGAVASPAGGFDIAALTGHTDDFEIAPGNCYVDGILCELDATPVPVVSWDAPTRTITLAQWTVDGTSCQIGQYLRLIDDNAPASSSSPSPSPVVARITNADYDSRTLTLDTDISKFSKDTAALRARRLVTYLTQRDLLKPPTLPKPPCQLYLDVWERLLTPLEDDTIREVALAGADTATRAHVVWQVKALSVTENAAALCMTQQQLANAIRGGIAPLLRARAKQGATITDPCTVSPDASYRGAENQLYRVEINTSSDDASDNGPTFKWSRDNGVAIFPVLSVQLAAATTTVTLGDLGRDARFGLVEGDYVEIQDDNSALSQTPGQLLQVQSIDRQQCVVVLAGGLTQGVGTDPALHPLLRRWDHRAGDPAQGGLTIGKDGAAIVKPDTLADGDAAWLTLEDGIEILFDKVPGVVYRTGDYWLIPARVATGDVLWPQEGAVDSQGNRVTNPVAMPPRGVRHHYAPLALITAADGGLTLNSCMAKKP